MNKLSSEQFANSGPSPTNEDAFATISHLADSVNFNHKHHTSHLYRAYEELNKLPNSTQRETVRWHMDHALKHSIEASDDAKKLSKHIRSHPAIRKAESEMDYLDESLRGRRA